MPYMPRESTAAGTGTWTENGGTAGRDAAVCCVPLVVVLAGPGRAVMRLVAADRRRQSVSGRSGQAA